MSIHCIEDRHGLRSRQLHALETASFRSKMYVHSIVILPAFYFSFPTPWIIQAASERFLNCVLFAGGISKAIGWKRVEGQQSNQQRLQNPCVQEQASSPSRGIREERAIALLREHSVIRCSQAQQDLPSHSPGTLYIYITYIAIVIHYSSTENVANVFLLLFWPFLNFGCAVCRANPGRARAAGWLLSEPPGLEFEERGLHCSG